MINYGFNINVGGNAADNMRKISQATAKLRSEAKQVGDEANKSFRKINDSVNSLNSNLQKSGGLFTKLKGLALAFVSVQSAMMVGRKLWESGTSEQNLVTRMGFFLRDKQAALQMNEELKGIGRRAPVDIMQLREQASLLAPIFGRDTMKHLKTIASVVAATGADFGNVAYNYGQIKSMGRTYGIDIRQFAMQNIPIYQEIAKVLKVPANKIQELSASGKITFDVVQKAFENMVGKGGRFEGALEATSGTASGQWQIFLNEMSIKLSEIFKDVLPFVQDLINALKPISDLLKPLLNVFTPFLPVISKLLSDIVPFLQLLLQELQPIFDSLASILRTELMPILSDILKATTDLILSLDPLFKFIGRLGETFERFNFGQHAYDENKMQGNEFLNSMWRNYKMKTTGVSAHGTLSFFNPLDPAYKTFPYQSIGGGSDAKATNDIIKANEDLSAAGVKGKGGIKNFKIEINAPIVQLNGGMGREYAPQEFSEIAANEFLQILQSVVIN